MWEKKKKVSEEHNTTWYLHFNPIQELYDILQEGEGFLKFVLKEVYEIFKDKQI